MHTHILVIAIGILLQAWGIAGILWNIRIKETKTEVTNHYTTLDFATGECINWTSRDDVLRTHKLIKK